MKRFKKASGSVLIIALWIVMVLATITVILSRGTQAQLSLVKHSLNTAKAYYLAWAGVQYAIAGLAEDSIEERMSKIPLEGGYFEVDISNEERKINLNALNLQNLSVFTELLKILEIDESVAVSVLDWKNKKGRPFDHIEELLLAEGMTQEVFNKLKGFITIFPKEAGRLSTHFETALGEVLQALARSVAGPATNTELEDADSMVKKFMEGGSERFNEKEQAIFLTIIQYRIQAPEWIHIHSRGTEEKSKASVAIDAVIFRGDFSVASWNRN